MNNEISDKRSRTMAQIRRAGSKIERAFQRELEQRVKGPFSYQCAELAGRPDIVHPAGRIVIFIDSCFWHGCPKHLRMPKTNQQYWKAKIARNRKRDRKVTQELRANGWLVLRIWEHSVKNPRALAWWLTRIGHLTEERTA